ncbi:MAG: zinc transporter ZntB [Halieaceae bacterium]|jgi:zinc transporter
MTDPQRNLPASLLHACQLDGEGSAKSVDKLEEWESTWFHFDISDDDITPWLTGVAGLNDIAASALTSAETRPRVLRRANNLILTLRGLSSDPEQGSDDMISVRLWTDGVRVISCRFKPLASTQSVIDSLISGEGAVTIPELIVNWVECITDDMAGAINNLEEQVDNIVDLVDTMDVTAARQSIIGLRQRAMLLRRYLSPQREALAKLSSENLPWLDEYSRVRLRDITDRLIRYIEDLDQVRDRAILAHEELSARLTDDINRKTYVFTIVAVIFLPLGFLTGLLGVNVGGVPGLEEPKAFAWLLFACFAICLGMLAFFRWRRWF